jgi:hypothetical protein
MVQGKDGWTQKKGEMDRDAMVRVLAKSEVACLEWGLVKSSVIVEKVRSSVCLNITP